MRGRPPQATPPETRSTRTTLTTRSNIARWTWEGGDAAGALELFRQLLRDREAVLGPRHPDTLNTRRQLEHWQEKVAGEDAARRPPDADGEDAEAS